VTLAAERGWFLRNEVAFPLGKGDMCCYLGLDGGKVYGPATADLLGTGLVGAVAGFRGLLGGSGSFDVFLAIPVRQPAGFRNHWTVAGFSLGCQL
jgi:hemolysin activation/secretion protein